MKETHCRHPNNKQCEQSCLPIRAANWDVRSLWQWLNSSHISGFSWSKWGYQRHPRWQSNWIQTHLGFKPNHFRVFYWLLITDSHTTKSMLNSNCLSYGMTLHPVKTRQSFAPCPLLVCNSKMYHMNYNVITHCVPPQQNSVTVMTSYLYKHNCVKMRCHPTTCCTQRRTEPWPHAASTKHSVKFGHSF